MNGLSEQIQENYTTKKLKKQHMYITRTMMDHFFLESENIKLQDNNNTKQQTIVHITLRPRAQHLRVSVQISLSFQLRCHREAHLERNRPQPPSGPIKENI